jgi:hypothetical protein
MCRRHSSNQKRAHGALALMQPMLDSAECARRPLQTLPETQYLAKMREMTWSSEAPRMKKT